MTSRLKALLGLLVLVCAMYVAAQVAPAWYANYQFQSDLDQIAVTESYTTRSEGELQQIVATRAHGYGIPLQPEQIRVQRSGGQLFISAEYTVQIAVPVHPFEVTFRPSTKNKRI
jgi:hypothetical protein